MGKEDKKRTGGILIDDKYAVVAMPIDYALAKVKSDKNGMWFEPFAYFGSIERCLKEYIRTCVHDDLTTKTVISLSEAEERIAQAFRRSADALKITFPSYTVVKE